MRALLSLPQKEGSHDRHITASKRHSQHLASDVTASSPAQPMQPVQFPDETKTKTKTKNENGNENEKRKRERKRKTKTGTKTKNENGNGNDGACIESPPFVYSPPAMRSASFLWLLVCAPALAVEPRPLTLDEALAVGRKHNRDLRATREHLAQVRTDVDRAWAPLLPTANAQGKYTFNYPEVTVNFGSASAPGTTSLSGLNSKLQLDEIQAINNATVTQDAIALAQFCQKNP